jgi:hypothetical protein
MWRRVLSGWTLCVTFSVSITSGANAATTLPGDSALPAAMPPADITLPATMPPLDIALPLPASWTMVLIGLGLGLVFYRLFSI